MAGYQFYIPTRVVYGIGVREQFKAVVESIGARRPMLVSDEGIARTGLLKEFESVLRHCSPGYSLFLKSTAEPTDVEIDAAKESFISHKGDCLVAVGGGGVIDTAKAVRILSDNAGDIADYSGMGKVRECTIPLVAVPTTAGTGSEVTGCAVYTDSAANRKMAILGPLVFPTVALADPEMTLTLPSRLTAWTGLDALTHAIGAYTATVSQPLTDVLACEAIHLIGDSIRDAVRKQGDIHARERMMWGNLLAGMAMASSGVVADHALGEVIGPLYRIHHGLSCGVFLPYVLKFMIPTTAGKIARIGEALGSSVGHVGEEKAAREAVRLVAGLLEDLDIPSLGAMGVPEKDLPDLARRTMNQPVLGLTPGGMSLQDVEQILSEAWRKVAPCAEG